jgi:hypothetical protein
LGGIAQNPATQFLLFFAPEARRYHLVSNQSGATPKNCPQGQLSARNFPANLVFDEITPGSRKNREQLKKGSNLMNLRTKWSIVSATMLMAATVTFGQDASTTSTDEAKKSEVAQRKENQQDRIAQGVKSGQLTPGETANLETKEAAINGETRADRAANGGKLTPAEKAKVNRQQDHLSNQIYNDKHNASTAPGGNKSEVGQRQENQQDRIAQGVKSGQLTAGETAKIENQERGINQQVRADRAANGGKLTAGEKKQINHEQNRESRNIYRKKHNARTQGGAAH